MKILPNHHAILVSGDVKSAVAFFDKGLKERGVNLSGNPDVLPIYFESLGIGEARELIAMAQTRPVKEAKKIITLAFDEITIPAQNALLKLFEDPNPSSEFLIATPNVDALLPTLRSRLFIINLKEEKQGSEEVKKFLKLRVAEKLKEADKMLKVYKDDGDKAKIVNFIKAIHYELEKNPKENAEALRASAKSLSYIEDKSSSVKILLESLILNLR